MTPPDRRSGARARIVLVLLTLLGAAALAPPGASATDARRPAYDVVARLDSSTSSIAGSVAIALVNDANAPLERVRLHLFPNRFRADGDEVNDITRMHVYPENAF